MLFYCLPVSDSKNGRKESTALHLEVYCQHPPKEKVGEERVWGFIVAAENVPPPNSLDEHIDSFSSSKFYNSNIRIHLRMCFYPLGEYTGEDIVVSLLFKTAPFTRKTPPGQSTKGRQFIPACITDTAVSRS